jgi:hypothetical protein
MRWIVERSRTQRATMRHLSFVLALSACVVNGRSYGPGGSSTTPPSTPASQPRPAAGQPQPAPGEPRPTPADDRSELYTADGRVREDARYYKEPPYLSEPADPWAAVVGDQPLRWSAEAAGHWTVRANEDVCTARRDHCLVKDTWFFVRPSDLERQAQNPIVKVTAAVGVFGPDGPARPWNCNSNVHGANLIAYRTVPATKANLVPGALVIGLTRERGIPRTGIASVEAFWAFGPLESVDYELGVYQIKNYGDTLPLEGARVAVLQYKEGGRVEILGTKRRDQLAVRAADVFMPPN